MWSWRGGAEDLGGLEDEEVAIVRELFQRDKQLLAAG
jgi:hypothetical protein